MGLTEQEIDRIIEMAWEDRTPFDAIKFQFSLTEQQVIELMRREMKPTNFKKWRARVQGRATKHASLTDTTGSRFKSKAQRSISGNRISRR